MKEMNKTFSSDQLFIWRWTNIKRWVIAGLPLQLLHDGLTVHSFKVFERITTLPKTCKSSLYHFNDISPQGRLAPSVSKRWPLKRHYQPINALFRRMFDVTGGVFY